MGSPSNKLEDKKSSARSKKRKTPLGKEHQNEGFATYVEKTETDRPDALSVEITNTHKDYSESSGGEEEPSQKFTEEETFVIKHPSTLFPSQPPKKKDVHRLGTSIYDHGPRPPQTIGFEDLDDTLRKRFNSLEDEVTRLRQEVRHNSKIIEQREADRAREFYTAMDKLRTEMMKEQSELHTYITTV